MGAHIDPDTVAFIEYLRKRGIDLGFCTYKEYKPCNNLYYVDIVWKLQGSQNPLFTFEIETSDNERVFSNTAKIFDTSSSLVPKPWRHFMIIYKSKLSQGHKDSLHNILHGHNILLFEDIFNEKTEKERLDRELDNCAYDISELLKNHVICKPLGQTIPLLLNGLKMGLEGFPIENPQLAFTIKSKDRLPEGAIKFKITIRTPKGQKTFMEKLKDSEVTHEPLILESPELDNVVFEDKGIFPENAKIQKITIGPAVPTYKTVKIMARNSSVVLEDFILREIRNEGSKLILSTEDRNLPFIFELRFTQNNTESGLDFKLVPSKANVKQAYQFQEFLRALNIQRELIIIEKETNILLFTMKIHDAIEQSEQWYDVLSKLAYIQEKTNQPIPCPSIISKEEFQAIVRLIKILNTGEDEIPINYFSITIDKNGAKQIIDSFRKEGKIVNMIVSQQETSINVCGEEISMGPNKISLPDMKFKKQLGELEQSVEKMIKKSFKKITLVPVNEKRIKIQYEKWLSP
jgi:hypothetical protein